MSIHPTAIVNPRSEVDSTAVIGPWCIIDEGARIGPGCRLYQNVFVTGLTTIGANCILHPGVIVGHLPQDTKFTDARSYCRIGDSVTIREYASIHRGTEPESETVIGDGCFLLGGSHVAHNCILEAGVTLINNVLLAGHVRVGARTVLGGSALVHQFVRIGCCAMIGGNARVPMDVMPFALVEATGKLAGLNRVGMRRAGLSGAEMQEVRLILREFGARNSGFSQRLARIETMAHTPAGRTIADFLAAPSKRGIAGLVRRRSRIILEESEPRP